MISFAPTARSRSLAAEPEPPRTTFQMYAPWNPKLDLQSDAAIVYGADDTFAARMILLKAQGYQPELMTGAAWGAYADYVDGRFEGKKHMDDAQVRRDGSLVMHDPAGPYYIPSPSYREYLKTKIATAIDALSPDSVLAHVKKHPPGEFTIVTLGPKPLEVN